MNNPLWPPCPAPFNMAAHVLAKADDLAHEPALIIFGTKGSQQWSFADLKAQVLRVGAGLLAMGLQPGDRVLLRLDNSVDFPLAFLGAIAVGVIPVPTSSMLTESEVAYILEELKPAMILRAPDVACPDTLIRVCVMDEVMASSSRNKIIFDLQDPNDPAYMIYTSGTSGRPRAVVHAHRAIWARGMMVDGWYDLRARDRVCHAGAFNWTYTLGTGLMDPWSNGATALIPAPDVTMEDIPQYAARHKASIFAASPGVYRKILNHHTNLEWPTLRHALSAGEKLPPATLAKWSAATGTAIYEAYGMSEISTFISACPSHPASPHTLGRPQPGRRVAIVDENGPVPMGTPGQIAIDRRDPGLMLGYLDAPEDTALKFRDDWFLTGDLGQMDAQGQIEYLGRNDDMMNAGGYRVSPIEVEAAMMTCPGVTGAAAVTEQIKPDVQIIVVFYTSTAPIPEQALHTHAAAHLARYKQPRKFVHIDALPTGANGKLLRRTLRDG